MSRGTLDTANCDSDFGYEVFTLYDRTSQTVLLSCRSYTAVRTPSCTHNGLGSFPFARRYLGNRCFFLFLRYLDVSVPRVPPHKLCIYLCVTEVHSAGFPHSEIVGSKDICSSPALIAAYHVFHRLSVPRHPPYALSCLTRLICVGLLHKC